MACISHRFRASFTSFPLTCVPALPAALFALFRRPIPNLNAPLRIENESPCCCRATGLVPICCCDRSCTQRNDSDEKPIRPEATGCRELKFFPLLRDPVGRECIAMTCSCTQLDDPR